MNIFANADYYYNTDEQSFGPLPRRQQSKSENPSDYDDDDQNSNSSSSSSDQYCESNPEMRRTDFEAETPVKKRETESCPPFNESDSSTPNSPSSNS